MLWLAVLPGSAMTPYRSSNRASRRRWLRCCCLSCQASSLASFLLSFFLRCLRWRWRMRRLRRGLFGCWQASLGLLGRLGSICFFSLRRDRCVLPLLLDFFALPGCVIVVRQIRFSSLLIEARTCLFCWQSYLRSQHPLLSCQGISPWQGLQRLL